jgi:hypothetical protein
MNRTEPVAAAGETVAVNVTDWPTCAELAEEVSIVVVGAWPTDCVRTAEVLDASLVSPTYVAVTE